MNYDDKNSVAPKNTKLLFQMTQPQGKLDSE